MGVEVHTERLWQRADDEGLARLVFVNMLDRERADFFRALESLQEAFGNHVVATEIPIGSEHEVRGVIDLIDMKAFVRRARARGATEPQEIPEELARAGPGVPREADGRGRRELRRADGALPRGRGDRPRRDRHRAQAGGDRRRDLPGHLRGRDQEPGHHPPARGAGRGPALAGDARRVTALDAEGEEIEIAPDEDGELVAYVFKTLADPYAGRLNLFRVYSGVLKGDSQVTNVTRRAKERIGQLLVSQGKEHEQVTELGAGDIGAVAKLKETRAGDVLAAKDTRISFPPLDLPAPVMAFAFEPKTKGDEEKAASAIRRLSRRRTRPSTSTATSRPASRSSPGSPRSTSR